MKCQNSFSVDGALAAKLDTFQFSFLQPLFVRSSILRLSAWATTDRMVTTLQGTDWQANRIKVYCSLGRPTNPQDAIKSLGLQLDARYRQVAARLGENEAVQLDISGPKSRLTITPLASLDEPDSLKRLSKMVSDLLPAVELTELRLEINAHPD